MSDELNPRVEPPVPVPDFGLGEEVLLDYVTGTLDDATALMVAALMELNPQVRAMVDLMTDVGGVLLEEVEPVAMVAGALESVLAQLDTATVLEPAVADADKGPAGNQKHSDELALLPAAVRRQVQTRDGTWSFVAPGVKAIDLGIEGPAGADASTRGEVKLYRLEPGRGVYGHTHKGQEVTLVLTGAFADAHGRFGPGDISIASPEVTHRPVAEKGAVCYALAITDAPLRLTGALGLVQRVLGQAD